MKQLERHSKEKVLELEVYTDGACKNMGSIINHKFTNTFGGWGFVIVKDSQIIYETCGGSDDTTNNIMELTAVIEAIKYVQTIRKPEERVVIYSDSAYVINCCNCNWWRGWIANGWTNSKGEEVKNKFLWQELIPYFDNFWYSFRKVKGHDGNVFNERCDKIASNEAERRKINWKGEISQ